MKSLLGVVPLIVFVAMAGCKAKPIHTQTFQPAIVQTLQYKETGEATWSCFPALCFHSHGKACINQASGPSQGQVGYSYHYENGTPPCNCWWYVDCVSRTAVRFELVSLANKNVVGARLKWSGKGACATRLLVPNQAWSSYGLSNVGELVNPWPPSTSGPGEIEVGEEVRDWVEGNAQNHGFIFASSDESFPNHIEHEGDGEIGPPNSGTHKCLAIVQGLQLVVHFTNP